MTGFTHVPVLAGECISALDIKPDGVYLDGTAGGGGHAAAIAQRLSGGRLYAIDRDPDAIEALGRRLAGLPATVLHGNFRDAARLTGGAELDGALLDLGVSGHQLDDAQRGFSYRADAALDMRMSREGPGAAQLVNTATREELAGILRAYGEEPHAWQIAGRITAEREKAPIETTGRLAELVISALPPAVRRRAKNPATRTFQALRIAVNGELDALDEGLDGIFGCLKRGGRFAVITFHSLEDRMVKRRFRDWAAACTCPPGLPVCVCGGAARARLISKKPVVAGGEELALNRRSRSAKLRVIEKL